MKYSPEERERDIAIINNRLVPIREDRGRRYGSADDTLANVRDADWFEKNGWRGALNGVIECVNRLKVMARTPTCEIDIHDFENASDDLINYAYYTKLLERQIRITIPCEGCEDEQVDNDLPRN